MYTIDTETVFKLLFILKERIHTGYGSYSCRGILSSDNHNNYYYYYLF
jgi:hypothetical protein